MSHPICYLIDVRGDDFNALMDRGEVRRRRNTSLGCVNMKKLALGTGCFLIAP